MNTAVAVTKALTFGPILGPALAASAALAGGVQIAKINAQQFAQGGMYTGGLAGIDSIPAVLQPKELVAPSKNFEEVIGSVRAQREAQTIQEQGGSTGHMVVELSFKDNIGDFIEHQILERRVLGLGAI
jgi:hypothetical protein